ncbi:MAG TPA: hypothetical protein VN228_19725 [Pyrinomonadaceae bacterium]|nr:hypothetical protein [Pyrinomonadaceae bacterium]
MNDQAHKPARGEGVSAARELGTWLRALLSFFEPTRLTPGEPAAAAGDFTTETRVVRDVLIRCLQLIASPEAGESYAPFVLEEEPADAGAAARADVRGTRPPGGEGRLSPLEEALRDACELCDGLLGAPAVRFGAWAALGGMLSRALSESAAAAELMAEAAEPPGGVLRERLSAVADRVAPDELGEDTAAIFASLALALDLLRFVEDSLRNDAQLKRLLPVFALVQTEAGRALDLIENRALRVEVLEKGVRDTLDGTAYAMRMELRKAFEYELTGVGASRQPLQVFARIENAHGLLRDCFQQSAVALAQCFDPSVEGGQLFPVFRTKLEQSLALRRELWGLVRFVRRASRGEGEALQAPLVLARLKAFEDGGLRLLMYKDREPFERFVEEAETAGDAAELAAVLHRFEAFLETLFGQVNMRAVLADHPFEPDEE